MRVSGCCFFFRCLFVFDKILFFFSFVGVVLRKVVGRCVYIDWLGGVFGSIRLNCIV